MKQSNSGFTLVEMIVMAILTTVMAGAGITIFLTYTQESRQLASHMQLQQQFETVAEQVALRVRNGDNLVAGTTTLPGGRVKSVRILKNSVQTYEISIGHPDQSDSAILYEDLSSAGNAPTPLLIGNQQVRVVSNQLLLPNSKNFTMTLRLATGSDTIPSRTERFRCRN